MRGPFVAVRIAQGDSYDSSWVIMAKMAEVNYSKLGSILSAIEKPKLLNGPVITKARLRALTRLASTAADRRLID